MEQNPSNLVPFTCPTCHGVLQAVGTRLYQCSIGHVYTLPELITGQAQTVEDALWMAFRTLEEQANVLTILAKNEQTEGHHATQTLLTERAAQAIHYADTLRTLLKNYTIAYIGPMSRD